MIRSSISKLFLLSLGLVSLLILEGCENGSETWTVGSKADTETQENRPWRPDKSTVAGFEKSKLSQTITPRVGFNMPFDEPAKEILKTREMPDIKTMASVKTQQDKHNHSIKIIVDQNK